MPQVPFVGPSYQSRSVNFDCQRTINLYLENSETGTSKSQMLMPGTPGLRSFVTLPNSPIRGQWRVNERTFAVGGNTLYEIFIDKTFVVRGILNTSTGPVGMSDNGAQLIVVDGPNGYVLTLASNSYQQISSPGFRGALSVTFIDGYFLLAQPATQILYISGLYDGLNYDPLDFASAEGSPDNIVAVITVHKEVWVFGTSTTQVFYNSGAADFPFATIAGAFMEYGCASPRAVAKTANTVLWLGQDEQGAGVVWMATGYQPQRISTFAIEEVLRTYGNLGDARGHTYQEGGHYFYCVNIPGAKTTLCWDIGVQQWHERQSLVNGQLDRHRSDNHIFAFGSKHLVGDFQNGKIYEQSLDFLDDDGTQILRKRVAPNAFGPNNERLIHNAVQVDMETGVGVSSGAAEDVDPQAMLRWSDDSGHTWSNIHTASIGRIGQYRRRLRWRRLGRARNRVYELTISTRTKIAITSAYIEIQDTDA